MITFISAADTELLTIEKAAKKLRADFPKVATFASKNLQTDDELKVFLSEAGAAFSSAALIA